MAKVAIIMGSKSDFPVVKPPVKVLKDFAVETEVRVISAHRTPARRTSLRPRQGITA